jgi:REP element-mobilizing transposase RayT
VWNYIGSVSRKYKFHDPEGLYFITFATVGWIDVLTRREYRDIVVDSLRYCQEKKGLELFGWVIMTNHVHLLARARPGFELAAIMRDLKKFTSSSIHKAILESSVESRREWMLKLLEEAGRANGNNVNFQLWQQNNQPLIMDTPEAVERAVEYIRDNPVKEGLVAEPEAYMYSSAYQPGLLKLAEQ